MSRFRLFALLSALTLSAVLVACDDGGDDGGVSNAAFQAACENGVVVCESDPLYSQTYGAMDCSPQAIADAYAHCDAGCRAQSKPIIDCQTAALDCDEFVDCVQF